MLTRKQLRAKARQKLADAEFLFNAGRYDGARYLCGYVIELYLKARICAALKWSSGFPEKGAEFKDVDFVKTHRFEVLIRLTGRDTIPGAHFADWSIVTSWTPESRYQPVGTVTPAEAKKMIDATKRIMKLL